MEAVEKNSRRGPAGALRVLKSNFMRFVGMLLCSALLFPATDSGDYSGSATESRQSESSPPHLARE